MNVEASAGGRLYLRAFYVLLSVFLYAPIVVLVVFSFNDSRVVAFPLRRFTTEWYTSLLSNEPLLKALKTSTLVASVSSVVVVVLGVLAAYALGRRRFAGKTAVSGLLFSPLVIPYLVFGICLLILFQALDKLLTEVAGIYFGLGAHAVVIGHVVVSLPYAVLTIGPRLEFVGRALEEAAGDLGASGPETFRRVTLPLLAPALASSFLIAFTLSFDEYAIASFLADKDATYPIYLYSQLRVRAAIPQMIAVSVLVLTASFVVVLFAETLRIRAERVGT
jgi:spermidine/putrescine transport system permease protein